ncbi:MAG: FAD-dependent oxidoreductase [Allorhizobium sp.]
MKRAITVIIFGIVTLLAYSYAREFIPSVPALKTNLAVLNTAVEDRPLTSALLYFGIYVAVAAFSIPAGTLMTLAGGALFGFWSGVLVVSFASSLGALLAFLASRLLLREFVQRHYGPRLAPFNKGLEKDGAFYLFTLRLIPVVPFFVVNLVMGLTPLRALTFYWVSQLGMLPATAVYINAGTQLAHIDSTADILSPGILASFALIGIFPWIAKSGLGWWKRRKVYARWQKPRHFDRNLVVIGAGAAGLVSAYIGATVKARVTLVEAHKMGGDCLNYGCVPSKALIRSARLAHQMRHADHYGLAAVEPAFSFRRIMERIRDIIADIAPNDSAERYEGLGVEVMQGYARITDPWTVEISQADSKVVTLTTRSIIIATGSSPFVPPLPGLKEVGYMTSDTIWDAFSQLEAPPKRMVILGGGPIGCEFAQSFARLGSSVTQIEKGPRLLAREDPDVSAYALKTLEGDGVRVLTEHKALACEIRDGERTITVDNDGQKQQIAFDILICAVGRSARLEGFGLEELGIPVGRTVETNAYLETIYPNILAAGDVAGPYQFTHTASHQAWYAAVNALFGMFRKFKADYRVVPWTTFIDPEVARVGLNEQDARQKGVAFEVTRYDLADLDRAIADGSAHGFVKVLTVPGKDTILGVTIVGAHAGDLLAEFVLAMKYGLGLGKILSTIHTYPTMAEANKYVAGEWRRAHVSPTLMSILERFHRFMRGAQK